MPLNIATSLEILGEHVPIPSSPDTPQISRRSRRLQHAARNDRPKLETREQNSSRKRHRGGSQDRNDDTNRLVRVCCTEGVSCEWAKLAMLQGKMISNLMSRVSVLEERISMCDLPQAIPRTQHSLTAEHASNSLHSRKYVCPVENCGKSFKRSDNLSRHIMDAKSPEHMEVALNLNQTYCVPCQKDFKRPSDFTRHEKNNHKETYKIRLQWVENGPVDGYVTRMPTRRVAIMTTARGVLGQLNRGKLSGNHPSRFLSFKANHADSHIPIPQDDADHQRDHTTTKPGALFKENIPDDNDNTTYAVDVCAADTHVPFSDGTVFQYEGASAEPPFLPQSFFDLSPYDLPTSPKYGSTSCIQSVYDSSQSPLLPPSFFDLGPYDMQSVGDKGFVSFPDHSETCASGSGSHSSLFDMESCNV